MLYLYGSVPSSCCRSLGVVLPLLGNNGKHVTVIARQQLLYYCVFVGKSKCFLVYFSYFGREIKVGVRNNLALCLYPSIVARQLLGKNLPTSTNTQAKIELLDASFSKR
jgi:hypothetical protein